jgi:hypothetical protein
MDQQVDDITIEFSLKSLCLSLGQPLGLPSSSHAGFCPEQIC